MHIAVIADTHDKLPFAVFEALRGADEIWHLGDVMDPAVIARLAALNVPVSVVRGNNDTCLDWPERLVLERGTKRFLLLHWLRGRPAGADFVLHGHTHVPVDETFDGVRSLNPGSIGKPNKGAPASYAWLDFDPDSGSARWEIVLV